MDNLPEFRMEYRLPKFRKSRDVATVISLDPGSRNMGISATQINLKTRRVAILANAVMTNPMHDLTKEFLEPQRDAFLRELAMWVDLFDPNAIVAERFQSRGLMGNLVESVNLMLGMILGVYADRSVRFITAATWKNRFQRAKSVDLAKLYKVCGAQPHQLDATLIGLWALEMGLGPFPHSVRSVIDRVEKTSLVKLSKRKAKLENNYAAISTPRVDKPRARSRRATHC